MRKDKIILLLYGGGAFTLGLIALVAAIVWRNSILAERAVGASTFTGVFAGILGFLGAVVMLVGIGMLLAAFLRSPAKRGDDAIPKDVIGTTSDDSLKGPQPQAPVQYPISQNHSG